MDNHSRSRADPRPPRFEDLWSESAPAVAAWLELHVRETLRPHLDPEDALQDVACRAFDGFARFDPASGPFRAWLFGIARHVARDESRRSFVAEVRALDDDDRRLLLRRGLEGLAHEDIARELGITTDVAIKRWTRLRERLSTAPRFVQLASESTRRVRRGVPSRATFLCAWATRSTGRSRSCRSRRTTR